MPATSGDPPGALAISEVARLTGLTTATLRVWQRRYGLGASRSSPGGHRRYSPLDVARLRAVQQLLAQGLPTAEAAHRRGAHPGTAVHTARGVHDRPGVCTSIQALRAHD